MRLKNLSLYFAILMIFSPYRAMAAELYYEDEDCPISFMIEVLPWDIVNQIIPNKSIFTIIDVETGLSFKVQRRAGSRHADVQPLTRQDTKIMKKIYEGKWSWKRRAILVLVGDQLIAASMHGMPHGAGALKNGFPGHFCVHFWESSTHRKDKMDQAHQLMILKADDKLEEYLQTVNPYELVHIFSIAINMNDKFILEKTLAKNEYEQKLVKKLLKEIPEFGITAMSLLPIEDIDNQLLIEVRAEVEFFKKNKGKERKTIHFYVRRDSLLDRWYIEGQNILKEL